MRSLLALISFAAVTASCSPAALAGPVIDNPPSANATPSSIASIPPDATFPANPTTDVAVQRSIDLAKQDLAARLKIAAAQISVLQISALTAADLYAGCTLKPGQALMLNDSADGYQITLQTQGKVYQYHADRNNQVVLCQGPNASGPGQPLPTPKAAGPLKPLPHVLTQVPPTGP